MGLLASLPFLTLYAKLNMSNILHGSLVSLTWLNIDNVRNTCSCSLAHACKRNKSARETGRIGWYVVVLLDLLRSLWPILTFRPSDGVTKRDQETLMLRPM